MLDWMQSSTAWMDCLMENKKITIDEIGQLMSNAVTEAFKELQVTTSARLIKCWIDYLDSHIDAAKQYKHQLIKANIEKDADGLLYFQCILSAVRSLFEVIFFLKKEENQKSWHSLIDSQDYLQICIAFVRKYPHLKETVGNSVDLIFETSKKYEDTLFPKQSVFNSPGLIETIGECSVCGKKFYECDHVEGEIYIGKYCLRVNRKIIDYNHSAIVTKPRDKRCIITTRHDKDGYKIDVFSRERIEGQDEPAPNEYTSILFNSRFIDVN